MNLAIDIGNTTVSMAVMRGKRVVEVFSVETAYKQNLLKSRIDRLLGRIQKKYSPRTTIVCSVVPKALKIVKSSITKIMGSTPLVVGQSIKVPIVNRYRHPRQVGQDRLVCAYAAMEMYGQPVIIIDFGTAITFDVVSQGKEYLGGIIVPGIRLSAESLSKKTALLPKTLIRSPQNLIGKTTQQSILSGLFHGYSSMTEGLIGKISKKIRGKPKVIVTGGYTELLKRFWDKKVDDIEPHLVFHGMRLLLQTLPKRKR